MAGTVRSNSWRRTITARWSGSSPSSAVCIAERSMNEADGSCARLFVVESRSATASSAIVRRCRRRSRSRHIFFFIDPATTEIYTLSLHDALPICTRPPKALIGRGSIGSTTWPSLDCKGMDPIAELETARLQLQVELDAAKMPGERNKLGQFATPDRKSTRLNSSHGYISYAVFCLK